ncbi:DUF4437 domain-containing protein [Aeromicrobium sp. UC242_57]|uniref:DUF4437 domain-containing protein n=1 Tax=Aeromicrobium sp. UC242_57 TaxID=3374624 RepID=UPI0037BC4A31
MHRDEKTGFYTRLIKAKPGWVEHPLAHHPCSEEAYCLEGGFEYSFAPCGPVPTSTVRRWCATATSSRTASTAARG